MRLVVATLARRSSASSTRTRAVRPGRPCEPGAGATESAASISAPAAAPPEAEADGQRRGPRSRLKGCPCACATIKPLPDESRERSAVAEAKVCLVEHHQGGRTVPWAAVRAASRSPSERLIAAIAGCHSQRIERAQPERLGPGSRERATGPAPISSAVGVENDGSKLSLENASRTTTEWEKPTVSMTALLVGDLPAVLERAAASSSRRGHQQAALCAWHQASPSRRMPPPTAGRPASSIARSHMARPLEGAGAEERTGRDRKPRRAPGRRTPRRARSPGERAGVALEHRRPSWPLITP